MVGTTEATWTPEETTMGTTEATWTPSEKEIQMLMDQGMSSEEIANAMI
jgi:hypothetical protein